MTTKINTKTMINYLPFPNEVKLELLGKFDNLSNDDQTKITDLVWDAFEIVYNNKVQENLDKLIAEADENGQKTDDTFYGKAVDMTDQEVREGLTSTTDVADLTNVRKSMELIVNEIKAAQNEGTLKK